MNDSGPHSRRSARKALEPIRDWLRGLGLRPLDLESLGGDVSSRRYYRAELDAGTGDPDRVIVAQYPDELRPAYGRFVASTALLQSQGVRVPRILEAREDDGLMLLEDLGSRTLFDNRSIPGYPIDASLLAAAEITSRISTLSPTEVEDLNPPLDADLLQRELEQTWSCFLEPRGLVDADNADDVSAALDLLCNRLGELSPAPAHRDFMARNLMPIEAAGRLAVIDHQDLRMAPPGYDLASLLNDSLYPSPEPFDHLIEAVGRDDYRRCAVQRTLKIVGTFVTFAEHKSPRYLELIAPSLESCFEHMSALPETREVAPLLRRRWQGREGAI